MAPRPPERFLNASQPQIELSEYLRSARDLDQDLSNADVGQDIEPQDDTRSVTNGNQGSGETGNDYSAASVTTEERDHANIYPNNPVIAYEYPVPPPVLNSVQTKYKDPSNASNEFTHLRYTAVNCGPEGFRLRNGYNLRSSLYCRHTELAIAITYCDEDKIALGRTLNSIMQNVKLINDHPRSEFWGAGGSAWKKIVVFLLCDGIPNLDKEVLDVLATMGIYQDGLLKHAIGGKDVEASILEYTTQLSVTPESTLRLPRGEKDAKALAPVQFVLCLKHRNSRKINSLRWFFQGFCPILNPEICVTIDVGTKLEPDALMKLWMGFYNDRDLAGAAGDIEPERALSKARRCSFLLDPLTSLLQPLVAAQRFEYKMDHLLDKPFESSIGYLTVLPGAFSAYRYRAIVGRPLARFFDGDFTYAGASGFQRIQNMSIFHRNLYLAEDRILSFELVFQRGSRWHTGHISSARATTDIPETIVDFIGQRRRWLNGSFATTIYSILHFHRVYGTSHGFFRKCLLHLQLLYNVLSLTLSWFNLAAFLLTTFIITDITSKPPTEAGIRPFPFGSATATFNAILQTIYVATILLQFVLALADKPRNQVWSYVVSFSIFGFIQFYFGLNILYLLVLIFKAGVSNNGAAGYAYISTFYSSVGSWTVLFNIFAVFGVYYAISLIRLDFWHMISCYPQYLFVVSSYTNILNIYAFSNWHQVQWGGKSGTNRVAIERETERFIYSLAQRNGNEATVVATRSTVEPQVYSSAFSQDVDISFERYVYRALTPHSGRVNIDYRSKEEIMSDSFLSFRTKLVAIYMFSNFFLCILVVNDSFDSLKFLGSSYSHKVWFFRIWMWATSATFAVRFLGSCWSLVASLARWFYARH